jgi:hypothetical protein
MRLMVFMNTKKQQKLDPGASPYLVEAIRSRGSQDQGLSFAPAFVAVAPDLNGCWTVLRRSYFHFLAGERKSA